MLTSSIDLDDEDECLPNRSSQNCNKDLNEASEKIAQTNSDPTPQPANKLKRTAQQHSKLIEERKKLRKRKKHNDGSTFLIISDGFLKSKKKLQAKRKANESILFEDKSKSVGIPIVSSKTIKLNDTEYHKASHKVNEVIATEPDSSKRVKSAHTHSRIDHLLSESEPNKSDSQSSKKFELIDVLNEGSTNLTATNNHKSIKSRHNLLNILTQKEEERLTRKLDSSREEQDFSLANTSLNREVLNQKLFEKISAKRQILRQRRRVAEKKIINSSNRNPSFDKPAKFSNGFKEVSKDSSNEPQIIISDQKENILSGKPSCLTKKRAAKEPVLKLKRLKNQHSDLEDDSDRNRIPYNMSMYDRRSTVFGMDNISDRTNISNGLMSRISNDDNSTNNQYYSSSSNLNGQQQQQQAGSIATLCNIGNTCYLNSVVYTLRFAPLFLHNLHHLVDDLANVNQNIVKYRAKSSSLGRNVSGLHIESARSWSSKDLVSLESNSILAGGGVSGAGSNAAIICDNQKSSQQIVTEKLHELYQHLHRNEMNDSTEPFHADTFLHAIQDVSAIFEGNQQQDAHEFLMCVLDNIRETCQSLIKAITECPDVISNGYVDIPEQINENKNAIAANNAIVSSTKEQVSTQANQSSNLINTTNLIKTSFFSRKSKRKDEAKNSKNSRQQSKDAKENPPIVANFSVSLDSTDGAATSSITSFPSNATATNILEKDSVTSAKTSISPAVTNSQKDSNKERLTEKIKKLGLDFFSQYFEGITVSTTKCLSCETITEQKETMIDIAVPISGYENVDCSESFIQNSCITREHFCGENKYRCEQCTGYTEAIRSISYEVLPRLLIIQLSRFSGGMEKINSYFPTPFTLQCFCSKCCKASDDAKLHIYKLYSVITHVGATMSVGHYIAYTCSLDWSNEYLNCPKDRIRKQQQQQQQSKLQNLSSSSKTTFGSSGQSNSSHKNLSNGNGNGGEKNIGIVKKLIYGRSKASSSGDMTKNMKNLNGISASTKDITNGMDKLKMGPTLCQGLNCCGIKLRQNSLNYSSNSLNTIATSGNAIGSINSSASATPSASSNLNGSYVNLIDDSTNNPSSINAGHNSNYSSMNGNRNYHNRQQHQPNEPIWYMCDDDKIKAMTQREFEELLSPNRKNTITPYLLFYARKSLKNSDCSTNDSNSDCRNGSDE